MQENEFSSRSYRQNTTLEFVIAVFLRIFPWHSCDLIKTYHLIEEGRIWSNNGANLIAITGVTSQNNSGLSIPPLYIFFSPVSLGYTFWTNYIHNSAINCYRQEAGTLNAYIDVKQTILPFSITFADNVSFNFYIIPSSCRNCHGTHFWVLQICKLQPSFTWTFVIVFESMSCRSVWVSNINC